MNAKAIVIAVVVGMVLLGLIGVLHATEKSAQEYRAANPQTEVILGTRIDVTGNLQVIKR